MNPIRVVIVDDSPTMRAIIKASLRSDPQIHIVGEAGDAYEAREVIKAQSPDVITLDINMPRMNGLEFLEKIMRLRPTPVIMVSSEVGEGASATVEALAIGAFDCVAKPDAGGSLAAFAELAPKIRAAAHAPRERLGQGRVRPAFAQSHDVPPAPQAPFRSNGRVIFIGASTGGVEALSILLSGFPANCPPTLITQHMPATFTGKFARRLDLHCQPRVVEAAHGMEIKSGHVYIAPGGEMHLEVRSSSWPLTCRLVPDEPVNGHRPSVDVLFRSAAKIGRRAIGVILTGMGNDGAAGLAEMREAKARTFGQDQATSLVYGMPRAAAEIGAVEQQLPLENMAEAILAVCNEARAER